MARAGLRGHHPLVLRRQHLRTAVAAIVWAIDGQQGRQDARQRGRRWVGSALSRGKKQEQRWKGRADASNQENTKPRIQSRVRGAGPAIHALQTDLQHLTSWRHCDGPSLSKPSRFRSKLDSQLIC